jgi:outer membrane lipoprotein
LNEEGYVNAIKRRVFGELAVILALLFLAGCASVISREALKEVDQSIGFEQLLKNPEAHQGKTFLLGGDIINTENHPEKTLLVVLQRPLGFRRKPASGDVSMGRFIVIVQGFLDPAIYRAGRKMTVVGLAAGKETRSLGEIKYHYPLIERKELYIWPPESQEGVWPRISFGVGFGIGF